ncbi:hypothetical protein SHKM778_26650 [Streptomyces sp. KM77-8]|uniref:Uncharacterized protein n=1 Tax=Streptomyces haneummycinicus TaxID=3074435 RepID=A0AAT9HFU1_9ACTN
MGRQQMGQGRGAGPPQPVEQRVRRGAGPAVGEAVRDDHEEAVPSPLEEFTDPGRGPRPAPAQRGGAGGRQGQGQGAYAPEGAAVFGGRGQARGLLVPDGHGGGVVDEEDQVERAGGRGAEPGQPQSVGDPALRRGLLVQFHGGVRGHTAGQPVQGDGQFGRAAAGAR